MIGTFRRGQLSARVHGFTRSRRKAWAIIVRSVASEESTGHLGFRLLALSLSNIRAPDLDMGGHDIDANYNST
jgi:hypothetical protein